MRDLQEIKEVINSNRENGRNQYEGLDSSEIGRYNQSMMWGDNWEAFDEDVYDAYTR
jgi:hypothetical protein